ncbi:MAG: hypothetical protein GX362_05695 [Methanosarcinaceae archaeon]|nr:hypothetical protein [Methanosarcinaceae archaeon]
MDIIKFVKRATKVHKIYSAIYALLSFILIFLTIAFIGVVFNMGSIMLFIEPLSPYVGNYPEFFPYIKYENILVILCSFVVSVFLVLFIKIIFKLRNKGTRDERAIDLIEKKYPELKERLKTAFDVVSLEKKHNEKHNEEYNNNNNNNNYNNNNKRYNIIQADLIEKVSKDIDFVSLQKTFHKKRSLSKVVLSVFVSILLIAVLFTGIQSPVTPEHFMETFTNNDNGKISEVIHPEKENKEDVKFTAENKPPTISRQPGKQVNVTLPPGHGIDHGDLQSDAESKEFTASKKYPANSLASESYNENLPEGYEEIIKEYFEKNAEIN